MKLNIARLSMAFALLIIQLDLENITLLNTKLFDLWKKLSSYMDLELTSEYFKTLFKTPKDEKIYLNIILNKK